MKKCIVVFVFGYMLTIVSCKDQSDSKSKDDSAQKAAETKKEEIPLVRDSINPMPVAEFIKKTDNPLNDWYFSVKLYETPKTFHYLIKLEFEEVRGEDTLK